AFSLIFPNAKFESRPFNTGEKAAARDESLLVLVSGWMSHIGPTASSELGQLLGIEAAEIEKTMLRLEASGSILRGSFTDSTARTRMPGPHDHEWCDRRLLARIHRLTVATLRKQIEPVTPAQFMRWLLRWQHITPESQMQGERAVLEALRQ